MIPTEELSLSSILASSIAPVTLVTGVAFLTSIMAPRFGRCIDRIRGILQAIQGVSEKENFYRLHLQQLEILYRRTRRLRTTMIAAGFCIFFVVLTICATFMNHFYKYPGPGLTVTLFVLALIALVALTIGFTHDFLSSLAAVKLEIQAGLESLDAKQGSRSLRPSIERVSSIVRTG